MRPTRSLNRPTRRRLDGRTARRPDHLARVCALIEQYLRQRKRLARSDPHIYGRHAATYYQDTLREEQHQRAVAAALDRVYGPPPAGDPPPRSLWQERYEIPPDQAPFHRRWFRRKYGPE